MNYCLICGKNDAGANQLCMKCGVNPLDRVKESGVGFAKRLGNTSIPDMITKGVKYTLKPPELMAIQDILLELGKLEKETGDIIGSARMYHLLGNFFSVLNNSSGALDNYNKALSIAPDNFIVLREKIRVLELMGKKDEAKATKAELIRYQQNPAGPPPPHSPDPPPFSNPTPFPPIAPDESPSIIPPTTPPFGTPPPFKPAPPAEPPTTKPAPPIPPSSLAPLEAPPPVSSYGSQGIPVPPKYSYKDPPNSPPPVSSYGPPPIPVAQPYSYSAPAPEKDQTHRAEQSRSPGADPASVNLRVKEAFQWINKMSGAGIETAPAFQMLQNAQELLAMNPDGAMDKANEALAWCEKTFENEMELHKSDLLKTQGLLSSALEEGIRYDEGQSEMEAAVLAFKSNDFTEFSRLIGTIKKTVEDSTNMRKYNSLLREFSTRVNTVKEILGPSAAGAFGLDSVVSEAAENLVAGNYIELAEILERSDRILSDIEELVDTLKEIPVLKGEIETLRGFGVDADGILGELSLAEESIGHDKFRFTAHFEHAKAQIEDAKEKQKGEYLDRILIDCKDAAGKLNELEVSTDEMEKSIDGINDCVDRGDLAEAEEILNRLVTDILTTYTGELGQLGERIEEAQSKNIAIPDVEETLSLTVQALNSRDITSLSEHFGALSKVVNDSYASGDLNAKLAELQEDLAKKESVMGENEAIRTIKRLFERVAVLNERGQSDGAKEIMEEAASQLEGLRDMEELFVDISKLRGEMKEGNYPDIALKNLKRELTIAERMMDTNIEYARKYLANANVMMAEVREKFVEERIEGHIERCRLEIEELEKDDADLSFAAALLEKISDISKEKRYDEAEVLFAKLDEEIAELQKKVLNVKLQERMVHVQTRMETLGEQGTDLSAQTPQLNAAMEAMQWGELEKAIALFENIESSLDNQKNYEETIQILKSIRKELNQMEEQGSDIKKAEEILLLARPELEKGNYDMVKKYAEECRNTMKECRHQGEMFESLERLHEEIEEAKRAQIYVKKAQEIAQVAQNAIAEFDFLRASNSIESARKSIRDSVKEFHELTELVKLSRLKIDETKELGANVVELEGQFNEINVFLSQGRYEEAKGMAKNIVEHSLSVQLKHISSRSRPEPLAPPPPSLGEQKPAPLPTQAIPPVSSGSPVPNFARTAGMQVGNTDSTHSVNRDWTGAGTRNPSPPPEMHKDPLFEGLANPPLKNPAQAVVPPASGTAKSGATTDLLAEIRNIYSKLDSSSMSCPYCSGNIPRNSTFCSQCGKSLK
ncbi:MAG: hypothetical protein QF682_02505 [Candidatus Thermoplasmatota archaeon]|nr:hypothetical protein [Candidatus Thermoplasmatota archaeon]